MKRLRILIKVLRNTGTIKILYVFSIFFVFSALIISSVEPSIETIGDGLWFAFVSVTTIGYGDFYPVTTIGRILTVCLAIYGIVVFAIMTGVITTFYIELQKIKSKESIVSFLNKLDNLENI